jgi:nucleotide-binding universal stress UspA family protein
MKSLFENLVVAVSGSDASISAAKFAVIMAKTYGCRLTAVYVVDTATLKQLMMSRIFIPEESAEYEQSLVANGERYLSFVEELAKAKGVALERVLKRGAIFSEIISAAEERSADAIILGGWEKDRYSRDIISNSCKEILYSSRCSVIVVKEPSIDQMYKAL